IALGIGASTAIFSVTQAVLLRPLPYTDPSRLVIACHDMQRRNVKDFPFSSADFLDLRNGSKSVFEDVAAVATGRGLLLRSDGTPEQVRFATAPTTFSRLPGGHIVHGRDFQDADGLPQPPPPPAGAPAPPRLPAIAILSHEYFLRRFGGDPKIVGK